MVTQRRVLEEELREALRRVKFIKRNRQDALQAASNRTTNAASPQKFLFHTAMVRPPRTPLEHPLLRDAQSGSESQSASVFRGTAGGARQVSHPLAELAQWSPGAKAAQMSPVDGAQRSGQTGRSTVVAFATHQPSPLSFFLPVLQQVYHMGIPSARELETFCETRLRRISRGERQT